MVFGVFLSLLSSDAVGNASWFLLVGLYWSTYTYQVHRTFYQRFLHQACLLEDVFLEPRTMERPIIHFLPSSPTSYYLLLFRLYRVRFPRVLINNPSTPYSPPTTTLYPRSSRQQTSHSLSLSHAIHPPSAIGNSASDPAKRHPLPPSNPKADIPPPPRLIYRPKATPLSTLRLVRGKPRPCFARTFAGARAEVRIERDFFFLVWHLL